jgi:hypothetical protein
MMKSRPGQRAAFLMKVLFQTLELFLPKFGSNLPLRVFSVRKTGRLDAVKGQGGRDAIGWVT